jgi:hypothetical protein
MASGLWALSPPLTGGLSQLEFSFCFPRLGLPPFFPFSILCSIGIAYIPTPSSLFFSLAILLPIFPASLQTFKEGTPEQFSFKHNLSIL